MKSSLIVPSNNSRLPLILISTISKANTLTVPSTNSLYITTFSLTIFFQIGDLKGFFGLFMVQMQQLRKKLKVLDFTYGFGTGEIFPYDVPIQIISMSPEGNFFLSES
jgi:hypothetical protein